MPRKKESEEEKRLAKAQNPPKSLVKWMDVGSIDSPGEWEDVSKAYAGTVRTLEELDSDRKEITRHLDEAKNKIMAKYKPVQSVYEKLKVHICRLVENYDNDFRTREAAKLEKQARQAEKRGEKAFALALRQNAIIADGAPPTAHMGLASKWRGEVADLPEMLRAIAKGKAPADLIKINESEINKLARKYREELGTRFPFLAAVVKREPRRK